MIWRQGTHLKLACGAKWTSPSKTIQSDLLNPSTSLIETKKRFDNHFETRILLGPGLLQFALVKHLPMESWSPEVPGFVPTIFRYGSVLQHASTIWVNYIKWQYFINLNRAAIWGWFPLLTMISSEVAVRSLWFTMVQPCFNPHPASPAHPHGTTAAKF